MSYTTHTAILILFLIILFAFCFLYTYSLLHLFIKGVPTISSNRSIIKKLIGEESSEYLTGKKTFYELGCSYGRVLFRVCKHYQMNGVGYESNLPPYLYSLLYKRIFYPHVHARVLMRSFYKADIKNADVIFCYLMPKIMQKVEARLVPRMKAGTLIFANSFPFKNIQPIEVLKGKRGRMETLFIYKI
ncbi:MAG: Methyltransferase type 12 [Parcubacteria group bacterium GW2011_GWA2_44_12]|nr:MAG: Methyltransferase type 12 [Parcubacteria group bacterium GW2011_GWA2_44_12]